MKRSIAIGFLSLFGFALFHVPIAPAQATCAGDMVCKGNAYVEFNAGLGNMIHASLTTNPTGSNPLTVVHGADQALWERDPGQCLNFLYRRELHGTTPPSVPNKVTIQVRVDNTATVHRSYQVDGAEPAEGTSFEWCATSDGVSGSAARAGTYRLYLNVVKDNAPGGIGNYNVNSDTATTQSQGALRARSVVSVLTRDTPTCCGTTYAYGTAADEILGLWANMTQRQTDTGVNIETVRLSPILTSTLVVVENGATEEQGASGNTEENFVMDEPFADADSGTVQHGSQFEIIGNADLTDLPWTIFAGTGHGSGVDVVSNTTVRDTDVFNVNTRVKIDANGIGGFTGADGTATPTHTVYNRGEGAQFYFYAFNARDEFITRATTTSLEDTLLGSTTNTFSGETGPRYSFNYTVGTTEIAAKTPTGVGRQVNFQATAAHALSPSVFGISRLYYLDAHPQKDGVLDKDDFPTQDADEDFTYVIGADLLFVWTHVEGVRLDGTEIDTGAADVSLVLREPDGSTSDSTTAGTGADGWQTVGWEIMPLAPAGVWELNATVTFNGNTGDDEEALNFVSAFTANLVVRLLLNNTAQIGENVTFFARTEKDDAGVTPDDQPTFRVNYVDNSTNPPTFIDYATGNLRNVIDGTVTINGALYRGSFIAPNCLCAVNVIAKATISGAGIRSQEGVLEILEGKRFGEWQGVWDPATSYVKNDVVQYDNSSWVATRNTTGDVPTLFDLDDPPNPLEDKVDGLILTQNGTWPDVGPTPGFEKWGRGMDAPDTPTQGLFSTDARLRQVSNWTFTGAFSFDDFTEPPRVSVFEWSAMDGIFGPGTERTLFALRISRSGSLYIPVICSPPASGSSGEECSTVAGAAFPAGTYPFAVKHEFGVANPCRFWIGGTAYSFPAFVCSGASAAFDPPATGGHFKIGRGAAALGGDQLYLRGAVHELRYFDTAIPDGTIRRLIDPDDSFGANDTLLGNETFLWTFEPASSPFWDLVARKGGLGVDGLPGQNGTDGEDGTGGESILSVGTEIGTTSTVNILVILVVAMFGVYLWRRPDRDGRPDLFMRIAGSVVCLVAFILALEFRNSWVGGIGFALTIGILAGYLAVVGAMREMTARREKREEL